MEKHRPPILRGTLLALACFAFSSCALEYTRDASVVAVFKGTDHSWETYRNEEVQGLYQTYTYFFSPYADDYFTAEINGTTVLFHVDSRSDDYHYIYKNEYWGLNDADFEPTSLFPGLDFNAPHGNWDKSDITDIKKRLFLGRFEIYHAETDIKALSTYVSGTQATPVPYFNSFVVKTPAYDSASYQVFLGISTSISANEFNLDESSNNEIDLIRSVNLNDFSITDYGNAVVVCVQRKVIPYTKKYFSVGGSLNDSYQVFDSNLHLLPGGELDLTGYNFNFSF